MRASSNKKDGYALMAGKREKGEGKEEREGRPRSSSPQGGKFYRS